MMDIYCFLGLVFAMIGLISTLYTCKSLRDMRPCSYKSNLLFLHCVCTFLFCLSAGIYLMLLRATLQNMKFPGIHNVMDLAIGLCFVAAVAIHLCSFVLVICELLNRIQMEFLRFTKPLLLILAIIATLLPLCAMIACVTNRIPRLTWVSERAICNPINEGVILFILFVISMIGSMRSVFCVSNRGPPGIYTCAYRGAGSHVTRVSGYPLTCGTSTLNRTSQSWGGTISNKHATGGGSLSDPPEDEESTIPMFSFGSGLRHPNDRTNVFTSDPFLCHRIPYSHTTTGSDLPNQSGSTAFLQASTGDGRKISSQSRQSQASKAAPKKTCEKVSLCYKSVYMALNVVINAVCLACFFLGFHLSKKEAKLTQLSLQLLTVAVTLNSFISASSFLFCYLACSPQQRLHFFID